MPAYLAQRRHVAAGQVGQEVVLRLTQQLKRGRQMVVLLHNALGMSSNWSAHECKAQKGIAKEASSELCSKKRKR